MPVSPVIIFEVHMFRGHVQIIYIVLRLLAIIRLPLILRSPEMSGENVKEHFSILWLIELG